MTDDQPNANDGDGGVLSSEELDITEEENVVEIEENRFVISAGEEPPRVADTSKPDTREASTPDAGGDSGAGSPAAGDRSRRERRPAEELVAGDSRYGYHIAAKFDDRVYEHQLSSNDITTVFENLLLSYVQHIDNDTPVEEVLAIMLLKSNVPVRYPASSLKTLLNRHGLTTDDSIADLVEVVEERGLDLRAP
jgi:hypothetical protein